MTSDAEDVEALRDELRAIRRERTWAPIVMLAGAGAVGWMAGGPWTPTPIGVLAVLVAVGVALVHGQVCSLRADALKSELHRLTR